MFVRATRFQFGEFLFFGGGGRCYSFVLTHFIGNLLFILLLSNDRALGYDNSYNLTSQRQFVLSLHTEVNCEIKRIESNSNINTIAICRVSFFFFFRYAYTGQIFIFFALLSHLMSTVRSGSTL